MYKPPPSPNVLVGYEGECPPQHRFSMIHDFAGALMDQVLVEKNGEHSPVKGLKADMIRHQLRGVGAVLAIFQCGHREGPTFDEVLDDVKWELLCEWYERHGLEMELEDEDD